jgi:predicted Zn-dependent protease
VIGGGLGSVISQGSQLGAGVYLLKFSREYETQADVLGAQIMARAGYDPRDLANMFKTIEQQGQRYATVSERSSKSGEPVSANRSGGGGASRYRADTGITRLRQHQTEAGIRWSKR